MKIFLNKQAAKTVLKGMAVMLIASFAHTAHSQVAIKSNLLYDATTTPNLGIEIGVSKKNTIQLTYSLNPWTFHENVNIDGETVSRERKFKHWMLQPEYRWWTCSKFNGHFIGVHAMGGQFNAANVDLPFPGAFFKGDNLRTELKDHRYEGWFAGAGVTYGYQWILGRHWNLEAEIGVGYNHIWYKKFECGECGSKIADGNTNYVGLTKLGLSILYLF